MNRHFVKAMAMGVDLMASQASHGGIYTDDLGRCLVAHTSEQDRIQLVRWIFLVAALHPAVSDISQVGNTERDKADRDMAGLMVRLMTDSCGKQTHDAVQYEGPQAIETSFGTLGQVAMRGLMSEPHVTAGFAGFSKYLDNDKLKAVMAPAK
ncbi:hypothetical protein [Frateuria soli]|uniref:hypothetical protein n=1 Tax=Frateuria soli TaxID=1542730 RepID=UPI001E5414C8|nr:hypothetical protein [Frateuria soli]UGB36811.1 hypothetical protein LQ771_08120 [Frateuria soli]